MPRPLSKSRQQKDLIAALRLGDLPGVERWCSYATPVGEKAVESIMLGKHSQDASTQMLAQIVPHLNKAHLQQAFIHATLMSNVSAFELLFPLIDPKYNGSGALRTACSTGNLDMAQRLLPVSNPADLNCAALREAATRNHWDIAILLMDAIGDTVLPQALVVDIIHCAALNSNKEILQRLLPLNSQELNGCYIVLAAEKGDRDVVDLLYPHSDIFYIPSMLQVAADRQQISSEMHDYVLHHGEHQTHKKIHQSIENQGHAPLRRKI